MIAVAEFPAWLHTWHSLRSNWLMPAGGHPWILAELRPQEMCWPWGGEEQVTFTKRTRPGVYRSGPWGTVTTADAAQPQEAVV